MLFSSRGPSGVAATAWVCLLLVAQVMVAARWCIGPMPTQRSFLAFAIFADIGLASVLMLNDPTGTLIGSVLFSVIGTFCTFFLSARWLVAHLAWSSGVILIAAISAYRGNTEDLATVVAGTLAILAAVNGVPLFVYVGWTAISRDARQALFDPLTSLYNRRGLSGALTDLRNQTREHCSEVVVVVIDIDSFKHINDRLGHFVGDAVISAVAEAFIAFETEEANTRADRNSRVLARTGGDEFLGVVFARPARGREYAHTIQAALRNELVHCPVPTVTVSIGAAVFQSEPRSCEIDEPILEQLIRAADSAMYRAKNAGGDRTVVDLF